MNEDDLLKKWLNNELSDAEKTAFDSLEEASAYRKIAHMAARFKASQFSKVDEFEVIKQAHKNQVTTNVLYWLKPLLLMASVFVIGLGTYFALFNTNRVEIQTLAGEKTRMSLPDLSQVTLNAGSEITYNADNWEFNRRLSLKGEAFFKVTKGKTFEVLTSSGVVIVVGTEFNVKQRSNYFEVTCYEGVVKVVSDTISRQLRAGDTYRILNTVFKESKTLQPAPNWTNNQSSFKAVPLRTVVEELERQYNVEVTFKSMDASRLFTGSFMHNAIENALNSITVPMNLSYSINASNDVLIYGIKN